MKMKTVLEDEVRSQVEDIHDKELGTETSEIKIDGAMSIADRAIKYEQIEIEKQKLDIEYRRLEIEQQKVDDERHDRNVKNGIAIGTALVGFGLTLGGYISSYKFEGVATHTSKFGKEAQNRMLNLFFKR